MQEIGVAVQRDQECLERRADAHLVLARVIDVHGALVLASSFAQSPAAATFVSYNIDRNASRFYV